MLPSGESIENFRRISDQTPAAIVATRAAAAAAAAERACVFVLASTRYQ